MVSLSVLLALGGGCAQEVEEIDRTQANIIEKKDLEGEWYFRMTTVDAPYASFFTFVGDQAKLERGVFEIQEGNLYFYRTYEFSLGSQTIGQKSDVDTPYLAWLPGTEGEYVANPYQARDLKYAEGTILDGKSGGKVACGGTKGAAEDSGMHEFCREQTGSQYAYCGHEPGVNAGERTVGNAVCVYPTRFVFRGAPLAAFAIDSHFDVIREYNSTTGEPTNVWVENETDRFWYEREFMRVDWSHSQIPNFEFSLTSILKAHFDEYIFESSIVASTFEGEAAPGGEELRLFRDDTGAVEYFDYVTKHVLQAPNFYYESWGQNVPICIFYPFYLGGVYECSSEEVAIRSAFMKVGEDDYVSLDYDDHEFDKFGYFRQERHVYDEHYEDTYTGVIRNIARWDIWETQPLKADGTPDYENMTPRPVVYYLSEGFPRELVKVANELGKQWAQPFNEVVAFFKGEAAVPASGMFVVCENNNSDVQKALSKGLPVAQYDPSVCRDMDYVKHNGDLRYSYLFAVNPPAENGLLGYGPSAQDPLTGKIINASAYVYMANLELSINRAADIVQEITGFIDYASAAAGMDISFKAYPAKLAIGYNPPPTSNEEAVAVVQDLLSPEVKTRLATLGLEKTDIDFTTMRMNMMKKDPELERGLIFDDFRYLFRDIGALVSDALDPKMAEKMALRNWANYKGVEKRRQLWTEYSKRNMYRVEFADGALLGLAREWKNRYESEACSAVYDAVAAGEELAFNLAEFNVVKEACQAVQEGQRRPDEEAPKLPEFDEYDPADPAEGDTCTFVDQKGFEPGYYWVNTCTLRKLAAQVAHKIQFTEMRDQREYWRPSAWYAQTKDPVVAKTQELMRGIGEKLRTEMVQEFRERTYLSVALHEVGHTLGLRHNFEGSSDAMNFPEEYWKYKVSPAGDGKSWIPGDLWTAETDHQINGKMRELQYSSIMDYGAKFNDLWHGIGLYDRAAIKYGYGQLVEVFSEPPKLEKYEAYLGDPSMGNPDAIPPEKAEADRLEELLRRVHYTQIPNILGSPQEIYSRTTMKSSDLTGKACSSSADCTADANCTGCTECQEHPRGKFCSPPGKVAVPFRFCSDEYAGQTSTCDMWDAGADAYEIVRNTVNDYWWYWLFWGHWRGKVTFSAENYQNRIMWAFSRLKRQYQWWLLNYVRFSSGGWWEKQFGVPWDQDINGGLSGGMAAAEAINTLINVFAIPEGNGVFGWPSQYAYNKSKGRYETFTAFNDNELSNRFILEEDYGKFGSRPMYAGIELVGEELRWTTGAAVYDRLNAMIALSDPTISALMNVSAAEKGYSNRYLIGFFTGFPDRMLNLFGGLTTHREANYAACVVEDANGEPIYLKLRTVRDMNDPNFCAKGHYLEPEVVDYNFPTTWYRLPMLAAYYGMAMLTTNQDRRFLDTTRIVLKGSADEISIPEGIPSVEVTDPMTGKTYVAYKMGEEGTFDTAWFLVNKAKNILEKYPNLATLQKEAASGTGEFQRAIQLVELIRDMHKVFDEQDE